VAIGRTLHASREVLQGHDFRLPQVYNNGVVIWNPSEQDYTHRASLTARHSSVYSAAAVRFHRLQRTGDGRGGAGRRSRR